MRAPRLPRPHPARTVGCRFYAHACFPGVGELIPNPASNQCAMYVDSHHPCAMDLASRAPDETVCPLIPVAADLVACGGSHSPDPAAVVERRLVSLPREPREPREARR